MSFTKQLSTYYMTESLSRPRSQCSLSSRERTLVAAGHVPPKSGSEQDLPSWEGQANLSKHEDERIKNCMYFLSSHHLQVTPLLAKLARSGNMAGYWPLSLITVF